MIMAASHANAYDLKDIFNSGSGKDILSDIGAAVRNATSTTDFSLDDMTGNWAYQSPGVIFHSDNTLQNLGGAAASATIESKLAPYYTKAGLQNLTMSVDKDHNFTIKMKYGTLKGSIEKDDKGNMYFNFKAMNRFNFGRIACMATKSGSVLTLAFDAKRMVDILKKISSVSRNETFKSVADLLSKYDGIYVGLKLKQQN